MTLCEHERKKKERKMVVVGHYDLVLFSSKVFNGMFPTETLDNKEPAHTKKISFQDVNICHIFLFLLSLMIRKSQHWEIY